MGLRVEFSEDENTLVFDGVEYHAVPDSGACNECAMQRGRGCHLSYNLLREPGVLEKDAHGHCEGFLRKDGRGVTWQRK